MTKAESAIRFRAEGQPMAFNIDKLVQVSAYLIGKYDSKVNYTKLIKEVYLADRLSLQESNQTITGDSYVCMNNGPVLSRLYDLIKGTFGDSEKQRYWDSRFSKDGYDIIATNAQYPSGKLSRFEKETLDSVDAQFHDCGYADLIKHVHAHCPEWENPKGTSVPLPQERVLKNIGRTDEEIEWILAENQAFDSEEKKFSGLMAR